MFARGLLTKNIPRSLLKPTTRNITFKIQQNQIGKQINFNQIRRDIFWGYRTFATSTTETTHSNTYESAPIFETDSETINELEKLNVKLEEAVKVIETQAVNPEAPPPEPGFFTGILDTLQHYLESLHALLGTPWWLTIVITCITVRTLLLPLAIRNARITAKMQELQPVIQEISEKYKDDPIQKMTEIRRVSKGASFFSLLLPIFIQAPIFIAMFGTLRHMSTTFPDFATGGTAWFTNLTITDPTYLLPLFSCAAMLGSMEVTMYMNYQYGSIQHKLMRAISLFSFFFTCWQPACIAIYWTASNCYTVLQVAFISSSQVRSFFGIPQIKPRAVTAPARNPVSDFWELYDKIKQEKTQEEAKYNLPSDFNLPNSNTTSSTSSQSSSGSTPKAESRAKPTQKVVLKESNKKTEKK